MYWLLLPFKILAVCVCVCVRLIWHFLRIENYWHRDTFLKYVKRQEDLLTFHVSSVTLIGSKPSCTAKLGRRRNWRLRVKDLKLPVARANYKETKADYYHSQWSQNWRGDGQCEWAAEHLVEDGCVFSPGTDPAVAWLHYRSPVHVAAALLCPDRCLGRQEETPQVPIAHSSCSAGRRNGPQQEVQAAAAGALSPYISFAGLQLLGP